MNLNSMRNMDIRSVNKMNVQYYQNKFPLLLRLVFHGIQPEEIDIDFLVMKSEVN